MTASDNNGQPTVFMLDLLATVPYYTAYLSRALLAEGVLVSIGSIPYYLDPECFRSRGLRLMPELLHVSTVPGMPRFIRRVVKLAEAIINLFILAVRFLFTPPDVLHIQFLPLLQFGLPVEFWFLALCRRRGIRVVLTVHDLLPHDSGERFRATYMKLYSRVDALICHSNDVRARLIDEFEVPPQKITVIPHGPFFYDMPELQGEASVASIGNKQIEVLWQGILQPYKGLDVLLEAWQKVEASGGNAQLTIAGTGDQALLAQTRQRVQQLGLQNVYLDLRFLTAEELVALYRRADIVVYPYRAITTSGALATGLALGKTIIASDLPVFREALHDGADGVLVPPGDAGALAAAILQLGRDPNERLQLAARVKARNFGTGVWKDIAGRTAQVYRELAG